MQVTDFCQFGTPWKKATKILLCYWPPMAIPRCRPSRGACSRSWLAHAILEGKGAKGVWPTARAQPYPLELRALLADLVAPAH
eukprot:7018365-Pyramimonas_sp.AAC.1